MSRDNKILLETGTNELEVIEFLLNHSDRDGNLQNQSYGINVTKVREIVRMPKLTKLPNLADSIYGIFNIRGSVIPALDLQQALYGQSNEDASRKMIITEFNRLKVGFIVSDVDRIHRLSWSDIQSPESIQGFTGATDSSIVGFVKMSDRHLLMLDVEKIVADIDPNSAIGLGGNVEGFKSHLKVLTADDSAVVRKMIHTRLDKAGFDIMGFNDGLEAWKKVCEIRDLIREGNPISNYIDVVISDIEMPRMDGYTLTKNIRSVPEFADIPVILFSSMINKDILHKGQAVGATAQLSKPQIGELLETIRTVCSG